MGDVQQDLVEQLRAGAIGRREFLVRALAAGASLSTVGACLQACSSAPSTPAAGTSPSASAVAAASSEPSPQPTLAVKDDAQMLTASQKANPPRA